MTPAGTPAWTPGLDTGLDITLDIEGMTCASCAQRIERKLNKLDGVSAHVSYATEKAVVSYPGTVTTGDLLATVAAAGYAATPTDAVPQPELGAQDRHEVELATLRRRLVVSAVLTAPVVAMAMVPALQVDGWQWLSLALAAPVAVWGAWPFHRATWANLRHGATTMDTLVSLGVVAAFGWSLVALVAGSAGDLGMTHPFRLTVDRGGGLDDIYLEVAAGVTTFLLSGRYLEKRAKHRAGAALRALLELGARDVGVLRDGVEVRVPVEELVVGDEFVVRPGEKVATDGVVVTGTSALDVSMLTGESVPAEVGPGDVVTGATVNAGGLLVVRARRVGADTQLAQMARLVDAAQNGKADVQRLADRVSAVFVPVVITIAAGTLGFWLGAQGGAQLAFTAAVAVLVVACPCALGLATPTALMVGTGRGAQLGILIRGPEVLEETRRIDTVVLDKTGTVTTGPDGRGRRRGRPGSRTRRRTPPRCGGRVGLGAPGGPGGRGRAPRRGTCGHRASGRCRVRELAASSRGDWSRSADPPLRCRRRSRQPSERAESAGGTAALGHRRRRAGRRRGGRRHGEADLGSGGTRPPRARACARAAHRRQRAHRARRRRRGGHRGRRCRSASRREGGRGAQAPEPRAAWSPWSATASTTPPRSPRPTSDWPWAAVPTSPSRPPT